MSVSADTPANDEIARVAYAIWEAEGQPEGRDHEHWMRARQLVEEGRAEIEYPNAAAPRPVQPGFEDTAPGMTPVMKDEPGAELHEDAGGRFAKQIAELPEGSAGETPEAAETPGPRNPAPLPATNADGYAAVASVDHVAAGAGSDDPQALPSEPRSKRRGAKAAASL